MGKAKTVVNNLTSAPKHKAPPHGWKKGQSGNPKGRPCDGESWSSLIKRVGDEPRLPGVSRKEAVVRRCYEVLADTPTAPLLIAFMDRAEGKLAQTLHHDITAEAIKLMQELGLTYDDIQADPGAADFFRLAGVVLPDSGSPAETDS